MPKPSATNLEAATSRLGKALPWLIGPACIVLMMSPVWMGTDRLAFRDVSHFYTPLYQYVGERCGDEPWTFFWNAMWNPLDQTGMPLAGETTTAVFYPVRHLVYSVPLPWSGSRLDAAADAMAIYVTVHLVLASIAAFWAARKIGCDRPSSTVASLVYPLSGTVLFLGTNPPFLVSAAWLPLACVPLFSSKRFSITLPAVALAMMVLGGDPQTALHVGIVALLWLIGRSLVTRSIRRFGVEALRLLLVAALAGCLSAPQVSASIAWARQSDRVQTTLQPNSSASNEAEAISVGPWRFAEIAMPNLFGTPWPVHHRWDRPVIVGGEVRPMDALWTPSLYAGLASLLAVLFTLRHRHRSDAVWWFVILMAWSMSMGSHGMGGAPYAWLRDGLPGYDAFRYPSKWLPLGALAFAMLTARGVQRASERSLSFTRADSVRINVSRYVWGGLVGGGGWLILSGLVWLSLANVSAVPPDSMWGPFRVDMAWNAWLVSSTQAAVVLGVLAVGSMVFVTHGSQQRLKWFWVGLIAMDLLVAHCDLLPRINREQEADRMATRDNARSDEPVRRWLRTGRRSERPVVWSRESDPDRLLSVEVHDRRRWYGRWHLSDGQGVFNSVVTIRPQATDAFWRAAREVPGDWEQVAPWLGIEGFLSSSGKQRRLAIQRPRLHARDGVKVSKDGWWPESVRQVSQTGASTRSVWVSPETFHAANESDVFVSRRVFQDGGWRATLHARDQADLMRETMVHSADGLAQGLWCPPGRWRIIWTYDPPWHRPSVWLAIWTWAIVLVQTLRFRLPNR